MPIARMRRLRQVTPLATVVALAALGLIGAAVPGASGAVTRTAASHTGPAHGRAAVSGVTGAAAAAPVKPVVACGQLATAAFDFAAVPDAPTYVFSAVRRKLAGAEYCLVSGYIAPQVQFALSLPVNTYKGLYMQLGCGGLCGNPPAAPPSVGNAAAVATDDQGHVGGEHDAIWASEDPALRVSFGYTSEHELAQAAKAIITAYYGKAPKYSYYDGCSGGGREALVEAQRYPKDFNGILAGAPGNIEQQILGFYAAWVIDVNYGAHGHEILGSEKLPALHAAVIKACGNASGLIEDPRSCDFNPAALRCRGTVNNASCLTSAQVNVVRELYLGPNDSRGHWLYPGGEPYGSELAWTPEFIDPSSDANWPFDTPAYLVGENWLKYAASWHNPPASFQLKNVRFTVAAYRKLLPLAGLYNATDPDLSAFRAAGGKLIMYQGWADDEVSPFGTIGYYKAAVKQAGGFAASQSFSRLYVVPNQYHCLTDGDPAVTGYNLMDSLTNWVEHGKAPGTISFPLANPTPKLKAIIVHPFNPLLPPPGGARGLNTRARWIGRFQSGTELWCATVGKDLVCRHHPPGG